MTTARKRVDRGKQLTNAELDEREQELDRQLAAGERKRLTSKDSLRTYLERRFPKT